MLSTFLSHLLYGVGLKHGDAILFPPLFALPNLCSSDSLGWLSLAVRLSARENSGPMSMDREINVQILELIDGGRPSGPTGHSLQATGPQVGRATAPAPQRPLD